MTGERKKHACSSKFLDLVLTEITVTFLNLPSSQRRQLKTWFQCNLRRSVAVLDWLSFFKMRNDILTNVTTRTHLPKLIFSRRLRKYKHTRLWRCIGWILFKRAFQHYARVEHVFIVMTPILLFFLFTPVDL